ncbi:MAG: recombinase RecA [Mycobacteriaceae bacterium]|nr:recombinase RecA [Mycobacteriaceae bacterium]
MAPAAFDRDKALELALAQIDKNFGKGSVMRLGDQARQPISVIPTGSIALDVALGIGGLPRGRVIEIYGPESSGKTTVALHAVANAQALGGVAAFIDAEHALDPDYARKLGVDTDALLVSQPDTGEQALEIADMLIRSGALDILVIDSVAALVPRAEIEGEMGDSHVGLQARLMSQALRKMTGALNNSGTTAIFINQLREKIGVMFGCFAAESTVQLADGTAERIGRIVDEKLDVEVLSYDPETDRIVPRRVVNWFDNGPTSEFLRFTVEKSGGRVGTFRVTANHLVRTPGGWSEAGELIAGDRVLAAEPHRLSEQQLQVVLGSLLGNGTLVPTEDGSNDVRLVFGHSAAQRGYLDWKVSLLGDIEHVVRAEHGGAASVEFAPLPELGELHRAVYPLGGAAASAGRKCVSEEFVKTLTPLALAIWHMDAGSLIGNRIELDVEELDEGSQKRLRDYLSDTRQLDVKLRNVEVSSGRHRAALVLSPTSTMEFQKIISPYLAPSMDHTVQLSWQGRSTVAPMFSDPTAKLVPARVLEVAVEKLPVPEHRYDIEVEGNHNYFVDGVMVHNSPETTTGGKALKFYASVRLDVRRIETLKDGSDAVGNRTRVKVVKNKVSPPFKQAEFDILYGLGISKEGSLIDMGVEHGFIRKSGSWFTYEGDQLGQGKENARKFLLENVETCNEIEKKIKEKLGIGADLTADGAAEPAPVDF